MIGNVIDSQLSTNGFQSEGAVLSLLVLAVLVIPMIYYVRETAKSAREAA